MHAGRPCWQRNARSAGAGRLFGFLQRGSAHLVTSSRNQGRIAAKLWGWGLGEDGSGRVGLGRA